MKRSPANPRSPALALVAFAAAAMARGDQNAAGAHPRFGHGYSIQQCLLALDLPGSQLASIETGLAPGKAALKEDGKSLRAAHDQIEADLDAGAEKTVLGSDVLAMDAARTKWKADAKAMHDQVLAQLSADQQDTFNTCVAAHAPHGMGHQPPSQ